MLALCPVKVATFSKLSIFHNSIVLSFDPDAIILSIIAIHNIQSECVVIKEFDGLIIIFDNLKF